MRLIQEMTSLSRGRKITSTSLFPQKRRGSQSPEHFVLFQKLGNSLSYLGRDLAFFLYFVAEGGEGFANGSIFSIRRIFQDASDVF
jgi:hypothetical protein